MKVYVGSLQYRPVFKSHCCAFGKACEKAGHSARYLFSHEYRWMLPKEIIDKTTFIGDSTSISSMLGDTLNPRNKETIRRIFSDDHPTHIYLHNYHTMNHYIAKLCRKSDCSFVYHVHEPYVKDKKAHGGLHHYWLHLFEHFQEHLLKNTDVAVVSSEKASNLFDLRYPAFTGRKALIPLMYEDLANSDHNIGAREYVTFVGPPVPSKNPEKFMQIVRFSKENSLGLRFLLISRSKVRDRRYFQESNLHVFSKDMISDDEYGELIKKSIVVLTPNKRETQSSVILVSYMYGTPVVSSNVGGLPEFVSHRKTGYLLDVDEKADNWVEGISYVRSHFPSMSKNCRRYFVENFSGDNWEKYLDKLLA